MTELIFIEGISGVGKSTMSHTLAEELRRCGHVVQEYLEGDAENPIDFYAAACLSAEEYLLLSGKFPALKTRLAANTVSAENWRLVRYTAGSAPLFPEPLLSELAAREFCYKPAHPIPLSDYTDVCTAVYRRFAESLDGTYDFIIFDGSLLHHPLNDLMRNYCADAEQCIAHVQPLLRALGIVRRRIVYLHTDDITTRLRDARRARGQSAPTKDSIRFWQSRGCMDMAVLSRLPETPLICNIADGWDAVLRRILRTLRKS